MHRGKLQVYFGSGKGKTTAALGQAIKEASKKKSVFIIQFLKGRQPEELSFIQRLEPEIKLFRFEKSDENFEQLPEEKKREEIVNIKNGMNFAKKVLATGECDLLILDEVLGLIEKEIITVEDLKNMLVCREDTSVILTGIKLSDEICFLADEISKIEMIKTVS